MVPTSLLLILLPSLVAGAAIIGNVDPPGPLEPTPTPVYQIDLATPPLTRWSAAVQDLVETHGFDATFGNIADYLDGILGVEAAEKLEPVLDHILDKFFPADLDEEVRGLAAAMDDLGYGDRLPLSYFIVSNLIYELSVFCTSIVAENDAGVIVHGRNLDYSIPGLYNLSVTAQFVNSSASQDTIFEANTFLGAVGVLNGMRPKAFSVSFDERCVASLPLSSLPCPLPSPISSLTNRLDPPRARHTPGTGSWVMTTGRTALVPGTSTRGPGTS